jgi:hypothetical protein
MLHLESPNRRMLFRLALIGLTLLAHGAVVTHDFIDMDDPQTIYANPRLRPPSLSNTLYYWQNRGLELYIPCTYTLWSMTAAVSGTWHGPDYLLRPWGFHLLNLCCHLLCVLVVFEIVLLLLKSPEAAALGAALFAVHPLSVEAVAWATGLKDVLSGLGALLAIWLYLLAVPKTPQDAKRRNVSFNFYAAATIAFALAVLAKPAGVAAVLVAAVLDRHLFQTKLPKIAWRLSPWLIIAIAVTIIAHHVQPAGEVEDNPLVLRPLLALDAMAFYLWKLFWPIRLCPDYGRRPTMVIDLGYIEWTWMIALAAGWFVWSMRRRSPLLLAGAAVWLAGLFPMLGFVPFIYQRHSTVADRYVYLAMLGPAIMLGWYASRYARARIPAAILIVVLTACCIRQEAFWTDSLHLFEHAAQVSPSAPFNHLNYGVALAEGGRTHEASDQFRQTLALSPGNIQAQENLDLIQRLNSPTPGTRP